MGILIWPFPLLFASRHVPGQRPPWAVVPGMHGTHYKHSSLKPYKFPIIIILFISGCMCTGMLGYISKHMNQMINKISNNNQSINDNIRNVWYSVSLSFRYWYSHIRSEWVLMECELWYGMSVICDISRGIIEISGDTDYYYWITHNTTRYPAPDII